MSARLELSGQRFGLLVAVRLVSSGPPRWLCNCDCGGTCTPEATSLRKGNTRSCGCLQGGRPRSIADATAAFWARVDQHGPPPAHAPELGPCWLWMGPPDRFGYGRHSIERRVILAHRASWLLTHGSLDQAICVLHKCDTPACVNPSHLFLGTRGDNARDMAAKGRQHLQRDSSTTAGSNHWTHKRPELVRVGSRNHQSKLTEETVLAMRQEYALGGVSIAALAKKNGVSKTTTGQILAGEQWLHVGGPLKVSNT